ncbi:uncharacterized protein [Narcine bancroftii]|uniref:uncharacterized protein n=1 Tax=Narcine bancroftii TaxID=1343680 RepID=UPI003831774C
MLRSPQPLTPPTPHPLRDHHSGHLPCRLKPVWGTLTSGPGSSTLRGSTGSPLPASPGPHLQRAAIRADLTAAICFIIFYGNAHLVRYVLCKFTLCCVLTEPVSKPLITSNDTNPVEHNDTVNLMCSARGTGVSYLWFKDNETVSAGDRITLSGDNSSLTISAVLRTDQGFTCRASNMLNENTSDPYLLNISYGPENLNITVSLELLVYAAGSSVTFSCAAVSNPAAEYQWHFNGSSFLQNGRQLVLKELTVNQTGSYTCKAFNNATKQSSFTTRNIVVFELVSNVTINSNNSNLIEYNDTVTLTCSAVGTEISFHWREDNTTVSASGRFELSADNNTLTIHEVLRTDGPFTCIAQNMVNMETSDPFHLTVYYGPDLLHITTNPGTPVHGAGSKVTLTCSTVSNPLASLDWYRDGVLLQSTLQDLLLPDISIGDMGNYTCRAFNNMTKRYNASTVQILVLEPVSNVTVTLNNSNPVENEDTILLTCDAQGTVQTRMWFKNDQSIQANDRILISPASRHLTISHVNRNETGTYKCTVGNDISKSSAETILKVNYGPENVRIEPQGPVVADIGSRVTVTCSALSVPIGEFFWFLGTNKLQSGQAFTIRSLQAVDRGNYTCQVKNSRTKKSMNQIVEITLREKELLTPSLSTGAIVGIVIGAVAGLLCLSGLVWFMYKKCGKRSKAGTKSTDCKMICQENKLTSQTDYAAVERKPPQQPRLEASSNGTKAASSQAKDGDIIYTSPTIVNQRPHPSKETVIDNKTDYAELKYKLLAVMGTEGQKVFTSPARPPSLPRFAKAFNLRGPFSRLLLSASRSFSPLPAWAFPWFSECSGGAERGCLSEKEGPFRDPECPWVRLQRSRNLCGCSAQSSPGSNTVRKPFSALATPCSNTRFPGSQSPAACHRRCHLGLPRLQDAEENTPSAPLTGLYRPTGISATSSQVPCPWNEVGLVILSSPSFVVSLLDIDLAPGSRPSPLSSRIFESGNHRGLVFMQLNSSPPPPTIPNDGTFQTLSILRKEKNRPQIPGRFCERLQIPGIFVSKCDKVDPKQCKMLEELGKSLLSSVETLLREKESHFRDAECLWIRSPHQHSRSLSRSVCQRPKLQIQAFSHPPTPSALWNPGSGAGSHGPVSRSPCGVFQMLRHPPSPECGGTKGPWGPRTFEKADGMLGFINKGDIEFKNREVMSQLCKPLGRISKHQRTSGQSEGRKIRRKCQGITVGNEEGYRREIDQLAKWCHNNVNGRTLGSVDELGDLGVRICRTVKAPTQVNSVVQKVYGALAFVNHGIEFKSREIMWQFYKTLARPPQLIYCVQFRSPHYSGCYREGIHKDAAWIGDHTSRGGAVRAHGQTWCRSGGKGGGRGIDMNRAKAPAGDRIARARSLPMQRKLRREPPDAIDGHPLQIHVLIGGERVSASGASPAAKGEVIHSPNINPSDKESPLVSPGTPYGTRGSEARREPLRVSRIHLYCCVDSCSTRRPPEPLDVIGKPLQRPILSSRIPAPMPGSPPPTPFKYTLTEEDGACEGRRRETRKLALDLGLIHRTIKVAERIPRVASPQHRWNLPGQFLKEGMQNQRGPLPSSTWYLPPYSSSPMLSETTAGVPDAADDPQVKCRFTWKVRPEWRRRRRGRRRWSIPCSHDSATVTALHEKIESGQATGHRHVNLLQPPGRLHHWVGTVAAEKWIGDQSTGRSGELDLQVLKRFHGGEGQQLTKSNTITIKMGLINLSVVFIVDCKWQKQWDSGAESTKFLGVHFNSDLSWTLNIPAPVGKAQHQLHFLRRMNRARPAATIMSTFYRSYIESVLASCIAVRGQSLQRNASEVNPQDHKRGSLQSLPHNNVIYRDQCLKRVHKIIEGSLPPLTACEIQLFLLRKANHTCISTCHRSPPPRSLGTLQYRAGKPHVSPSPLPRGRQGIIAKRARTKNWNPMVREKIDFAHEMIVHQGAPFNARENPRQTSAPGPECTSGMREQQEEGAYLSGYNQLFPPPPRDADEKTLLHPPATASKTVFTDRGIDVPSVPDRTRPPVSAPFTAPLQKSKTKGLRTHSAQRALRKFPEVVLQPPPTPEELSLSLSGMAGLPLTALAACFFILWGESQGLTIHTNQSQINVTAGGDAIFSVRPSVEVNIGNWTFEAASVVTWVGTSIVVDNAFTSRAELFLPNGSLLLKSVTTSDSGDYTVTMTPEVGDQQTATIALLVIEPVSKPLITSNDTNPVEHNDTVNLMCSARGTGVSYLWFKDNETVSAGDRITLSGDNSSLTISAVLRTDQEFTCRASNMLNENTSDPYLLNVSYGPENLMISISPERAVYSVGSNVTFTCSAVSNPAPKYSWLFNGSSYLWSGRQLVLADLTANRTGSYICVTFNNATKWSRFTTRSVVVFEPVTNVTINSNDSSLIEYNDTVTLTCSAAGSEISYYWRERNIMVYATRWLRLNGDNSTLTIHQVLRTDGPFTCIAQNVINMETSDPFHLTVYYGPEQLNITTNPATPVHGAGSNITLTCSAVSNPLAGLHWYYDGVSLQKSGKDLLLPNVSIGDMGNYTCLAFNNLTKRYSASTVQINVVEPVSNVTINSNDSSLIEYNDTVTLTCSAAGTEISYYWREHNIMVYETRWLRLNGDNSTLTIHQVLLTDGPFTCVAQNVINMETSDPFHLTVYYGPENLNITTNPATPVHGAGSNITLTCSAVSNPLAGLHWYYDGVSLQKSGKDLLLPNVSIGDMGNYTCLAFNNLTKRYSASTVQINVVEPVTIVTINSNDSSLIEHNDTVTLTCSAAGKEISFYWREHNIMVYATRWLQLSADNSTLTIHEVLRTYGPFTCIAQNVINMEISDPFHLTVYYGPEHPNITTNPATPVHGAGSNITLTCSAVSNPLAGLQWYYDGVSLQKSGQDLLLPNVSIGDMGNYTCLAFNNLTKRYSASTVQINVVERLSPGGLSAGAKAGIAIGVIGGAAMVCGLVVWFVRSNMNRGKSPGRRDTKTTARENYDENTSGVYENIQWTNKPTLPPDDNSTYMGLYVEDRSIYCSLKR